MASKIYGGKLGVKIKLPGGEATVFPECQAESKEDTRLYGFPPQALARYRSEGNKLVIVGERYLFNARLMFMPLDKVYLKKLFEAQKEAEFELWLNSDVEEIKYKARINGEIKHRYFKGNANPDNSPGYEVTVDIIGTEYLSDAGYGALYETSRYGTGYGTDYGKPPA